MNSDKVITVVGKPHPLRTDRIVTTAIEGQSIQQIITEGLNRLAVPKTLWDYGHVYVNDKYINPNDWSNYYPVPGDTINYRVVPQGGGGGKNPFKTLLSIVVIAVASIVGNAVGGMFAGSVLGSVAGAVTTMGITALGMLAINALFPYRPESLSVSDNSTDSSVYSLSGATNQINKFGAIPVLLGRHRITPPQAALPYTELVGDDQYVMQLFCNGYSGYGIEEESNFRVGETNISSYDEFNIDRVYRATTATIPKYYKNDIYEESLAIELKQADGWNTRTTSQEANTFSVDLVAPNGLRSYSSSTGEVQSHTVELEVRWRKMGDTTWKSLGGITHAIAEETFVIKPVTLGRTGINRIYVDKSGDLRLTTGSIPGGSFGVVQFEVLRGSRQIGNIVDLRIAGQYTDLSYSFSSGWEPNDTHDYLGITVTISAGTCSMSSTVFTASQTKPIRRTFTPGNVSSTPVYFEVGVRRITVDSTASTVVDAFSWATLRAISYKTPIGTKIPVDIASIKVKATGELNGTINEFNFDAVSVCKDWDRTTGAWVLRGTNNPASLFRYVLQHPANAKAKPDSSINLAVLQDWHEFCEEKELFYNRYFDFRSSVVDVLREIASAGLARPDCTNSLWGVIIDRPRSIVTQMFTPRNSWDFKATRYFPELPHGWRVTFINEKEGYQPDEMIVYADDYDASNATIFEGIEFPGVTDPDQIVRVGRQYYAEAALCQEEFSFNVDFEHLVCTKGDRIKCSHYVTMWGSAYGRVKNSNADNQSITVDEVCVNDGVSTYVIRWRDSQNQLHIRTIGAISDEGKNIYLIDSGDLPSKGDLFIFGKLQLDSVDLLIKEIKDRGENLTARLVCKPYIPAIYDAVNKPLPDYQTKITKPPSLALTVTPPVINSVISYAEINNAVISTGLKVFFSAIASDTVQVQYKETGADEWINGNTVATTTGTVTIPNTLDNIEYTVRLRAVKNNVYTSVWKEAKVTFSLTEAVFELCSAWSSANTNFTSVAQDNQVVLKWSLSLNGVTGYELRLGDTWETATVLATNLVSDVWYWRPTQSGDLKFLLKGIVLTGNYTVETATFVLPVSNPKATNLSKSIIGNNVLLSWTNEQGTYAIDRVEIRKGLDYATSLLVGTVSGTFTTIFESTAGTYKYWVTPVDKAGLYGDSIGTYALVNKPANYVLLDEVSLTWTGESTNIIVDNSIRYALLNSTESWEDHFIDNDFASPQGQIDEGLPFYAQPGLSTASYSEIFDHGSVIELAILTLALTRTTITGTVNVTPVISVSLDGVTWTSGVSGDYQFYGTDFRYSKVEINITSSDNGILILETGTLVLDVQIKQETGSVSAVATDITGTVVYITGYSDIRGIKLSAKSISPVIVAYDFDDVGNPTEFSVYAWDTNGNRVNADLTYELEGV